MIIGPKYKIARRLGPNIFDKTQTQKYALRADSRTAVRGKRPGSDFGIQLIEKQKARLTYGLGERQFKSIVENIIEKGSGNMNESFIQELETRLDNVIYRLGLAPTRQAARQMVNHGHVNVNGKRQTIPSYKVSVGEVIAIRENSKQKPLFKDISEKLKEHKVPSWLTFNMEKREAKVQGLPKLAENELSFDVSQIFQYYSK